MSQSWQCPQCKAINQKPDYILRLAKLSQSLGAVSLGTTGNPPPHCSQCRFEANINAMLTGEYDHAGPEKVQSTPPKQDRTALFVVIGVCIVLLILCVLVAPAILDYLDRGNGIRISSPQATPRTVATSPPSTPGPPPPTSVRMLTTDELKSMIRRSGIYMLEKRVVESSWAGKTLTYKIQLEKSEPLGWAKEWCASTEAILADNMQHILFTFILDGRIIPLDSFHRFDYDTDDPPGFCTQYMAVLTDWTPGEYLIISMLERTEPINDGWDEYPADTQIFEYRVTVLH